MYTSRRLLKANARTIIQSAKPSVISAALIYIAVTALLSYLSRAVAGYTPEDLAELIEKYAYGSASMNGPTELYYALIPSPFARFLIIAIRVVSYVLSAGFLIFLFNTVKKSGAVYGNLLDGFELTGKLIWLSFLQGLFVFLLTLPFFFLFSLVFFLIIYVATASNGSAAAFLDAAFSAVGSPVTDPAQMVPLLLYMLGMFLLMTVCVLVPMLIFNYRYRMGLFYLLDHPEMRAIDCLRASKKMMSGHKWECFKLDLSFLGWYILLFVPVFAFAFAPSFLPLVGTALSYAVLVWVQPYINTTMVLYYMALAGKPVIVSPSQGQPPYGI